MEPRVVTVYSRDIEMKDVVIITLMAIMKMYREKTLWQILYSTPITVTICLVLYSSYEL